LCAVIYVTQPWNVLDYERLWPEGFDQLYEIKQQVAV